MVLLVSELLWRGFYIIWQKIYLVFVHLDTVHNLCTCSCYYNLFKYTVLIHIKIIT